MMNTSRYLADAHRPAMADADKSGLPQTIFYHPDWLFSNTVFGSKLLSLKDSEQFVTWLPNRYFS